MAGNYMNAPASRLAYDRDGSIMATRDITGTLTVFTGTQTKLMNSESEAGITLTAQSGLILLFPMPMDLSAVFFSETTYSDWTLESSVDTTTGLDGTWITHRSPVVPNKQVKPNYRIETNLVSFLAGSAQERIRGIRISKATIVTTTWKALHVYGEPSDNATKDRLEIWHPTLSQKIGPSYLDWGNVPRSSSADIQFRVKNLSPVLTADQCTVYVEALTPGVPSVAGMHTLSDNDGATFLPSVTIPSLAPGEVSGALILRRVVPATAQVASWSARVAVDVTTWI